MKKNRIALFVLAAVLCLCVGLVGCGGNKDKSDRKGAFDAVGYQGTLEDGWEFVYIQVGGESTMISLTDETHTGDDAITYSGQAVTDDAGKITVTDDESGESISFTFTENGDGTAEVEVDGHGKGTLTAYEGNIFKMITEMAEDDDSE